MQKKHHVIVPLLAILTLSVPLGASIADRPIDPAHATVAVATGPDGCALWDADQLVETVAYQEAFDHYDDMPGFVDLLFVDTTDARLVALFDEAAVDEALPAALDPVHGIPVVVASDTFTPLMADYSEAVLTNTLPPVPGACGGIQPGARLVIGGAGCSANFVFVDQDGVYYLGTAGHCGVTGRRVSIGNQGESGTIIYSTGNGGVGRDFALIRIDDDKQDQVEFGMCYWGGPTEVHDVGGGRVVHYGFPVIYSGTHATRPRVAEVASSSGANSFTIYGLVASGDSGSGARHEHGGAMGTLTHVNGGIGVGFAHSAPYAFGTKVARGLALAEAATGLDFEIVTAPVDVDLPL